MNLEKSNSELINENKFLKDELGHLKEYKENFYKLQNELEMQKEVFNLVFNNSLDVIFIVDSLTKKIIDVNKSVVDLLGYDRIELIGKPFSYLFPETESLSSKELISKLDVFDSVLGTQEFKLANGLVCYMDLTASLLEFKKQKTFLITLRKSNERKKNLDSLKEKEVLLHEIHHRVKNNLQIIYSLLFLQSEYFNDPQTLNAFKESQSRVFSMALVHDKLYESKNLSFIDFREYLISLTKSLFQSYKPIDKKIELNILAEKVFLDFDSAVPVGLIINELVSNSLKHAFEYMNEGSIEIRFEKNQSNFLFSLKDNGKGLPQDFSTLDCKSLGLKLVMLLAKQLNGQIEIKQKNGVEIILTFIKRNF